MTGRTTYLIAQTSIVPSSFVSKTLAAGCVTFLALGLRILACVGVCWFGGCGGGGDWGKCA